MANSIKAQLLEELTRRFGAIKKLNDSQSLFDIANGAARVYIRYSKLHPRRATFYGLREVDLRLLEGRPSFLCFLWDDQTTPLLVPYSEYEQVFQRLEPAADGQYKAQVYPDPESTELYVAGAGRFNVEDHFGWSLVESVVRQSGHAPVPVLSHSQVQTLLGSIGAIKGFDIWIPVIDRGRLDWSCSSWFSCSELLPFGFEMVKAVLQEIDVIWIQRGSGHIAALFEVEHSTPIYSGLLRLNDVHLVAPNVRPRFTIVANDARRDVFVAQLSRPTFKVSGLSEVCSFLEYGNVFGWHKRMMQNEKSETLDSR
jgi:hypothetical protein